MLLNKITKYMIAWVLIGTLCYLAQPEDKPLPGSDFPIPEEGRPSYGWDFEKQEYKYLEPNPNWDKPKPKYIPVEQDTGYDPVDELLLILD